MVQTFNNIDCNIYIHRSPYNPETKLDGKLNSFMATFIGPPSVGCYVISFIFEYYSNSKPNIGLTVSIYIKKYKNNIHFQQKCPAFAV